jgi:hypothetical protein
MILYALGFAIVISLFWHAVLSKFWISVLLSGISSVVLMWRLAPFQLDMPAEYVLYENYLDYFGILVMSLFISIAIGKFVLTIKVSKDAKNE